MEEHNFKKIESITLSITLKEGDFIVHSLLEMIAKLPKEFPEELKIAGELYNRLDKALITAREAG